MIKLILTPNESVDVKATADLIAKINGIASVTPLQTIKALIISCSEEAAQEIIKVFSATCSVELSQRRFIAN